MPRKKTIQPDALETFTIDEGRITVEIRDGTCNIIGRGLHKRDTHEELRVGVLEWVVDQYLSSEGPKLITHDFMKSASELDAEMARSGLFPEVTESSSVRKRIYPWVREQLTTLTKLVWVSIHSARTNNCAHE